MPPKSKQGKKMNTHKGLLLVLSAVLLPLVLLTFSLS